jgi:hypothetical protein
MTAGPAELDAARLLLARLGISHGDLLAAPQHRPQVPTFTEYIPTVSRAVTDGTCRMYGTYWNRILEQWADRRLDEPTPSEIKQLAEHVRTHVVIRRNTRADVAQQNTSSRPYAASTGTLKTMAISVQPTIPLLRCPSPASALNSASPGVRSLFV